MNRTSLALFVVTTIAFVLAAYLAANSVLAEVRMTRQALELYRAPVRWTGDVTSPIHVYSAEKPKLELSTNVTTPNGSVVNVKVICGQTPGPANETEEQCIDRFKRNVQYWKDNNP